MKRARFLFAVMLVAIAAVAVWWWSRKSSPARPEAANERVATPAVESGSPEHVEAARESIAPSEARSRELESLAPVLRGRVVYASTGQGLPWCQAALIGERGMQYITTDAEGRWSCGTDPGGALSFALLAGSPSDVPPSRVELEKYAFPLERKSGGETATFAVHWWPTFVFEGLFPDQELTARFDNLVHDSNLTSVERAPDGTRFWRFAARFSARPGTEPFEPLFDDRPPWRLRIEREDGLARGHGAAQSLRGVVVVPIQWEGRGAIELTVKTRLEPEPHWRASVSICNALGTEGFCDERPLLVLGNSETNVRRCSDLPPGPYVARVRTSFCRFVEEPFEIRAGETTRRTVQLACPPPRGSIVVEVTNQSREPTARGVGLWRNEGQEFVEPVEPQFLEDEPVPRTVYEFTQRPEGEYQVWIVTDLPVLPSRKAVARVGDHLHFEVQDLAPRVEVGFRVFDASTGAEVTSFDAEFEHVDPPRAVRGARSGSVLIHDVPDGGALEWRISAAGFWCERGSLESAASTRLEQGVRWVDVPLEHGWNSRVLVRDADGNGLARATVVADEVVVGSTDAHGELDLKLRETPTSIDVRYRDWTITERPLDLTKIHPCYGIGFVLSPP